MFLKSNQNHENNDLLREYPTEVNIIMNHQVERNHEPISIISSPARKCIDEEAISNVQSKFNNFIGRIESGLSKNPNDFVSALRSMLSNAKKFTASDSALVSALCSFGVNTTTSKSSKVVDLEDESVPTDEQISSINKTRKLSLTGRKSLSVTRSPSLVQTRNNQYNYLESTNSIDRKRKRDPYETIDVQEETIKNKKQVIEIKSFKVL